MLPPPNKIHSKAWHCACLCNAAYNKTLEYLFANFRILIEYFYFIAEEGEQVASGEISLTKKKRKKKNKKVDKDSTSKTMQGT